MGLLSAIFGAKPPYGTPPFAPPHPITGGSEIPTTPETLPVKQGLAGFINRAFDPTNALGQFGQALVASGGGPLGNAMALMMQANAQKTKRHFEHIGKQFGIVDDSTGQFTPTYTEPDTPDKPTGFSAELLAAGIDPESDQGKADLLQHVNNSLDPWITASNPQGSYYGPRSGLPNVFGGAPAAPVGKITPIDDPAPANTPPAGYDAFKGAVVGQETGGRYGVPNAQGSGAMGVGQVMPATARVLAGRLGMPYRPDLMGGTDPSAQAYQNSITDAAAREAWQAAGGDPAKAAMYYFGGSNTSKWGPKTRQYASDILTRLGG